MQPENRYYKYDFLYDNCATRIRDIINKAVYPDTVFRNVPEKNSKTFRKLLSQYLKTSPWEHAGIDIVLGLPDDKPANSYDATFLPDYLSFATAKAVRKNGQALVSSTAAISSVEKTPVNPLTNPVLLIGLVILGLSILSIYRKNLAKVNDVFLLTIISLIGFVICFLWFASDLAATKNNLNLLWALPTNIFAYIFVQKLIWRKYYFGFAGILSLVIFIMSWYPQQLHYALYPLILAVIIRSINISYSCQNELKTKRPRSCCYSGFKVKQSTDGWFHER
jgi:hypothetical protein